MSTYNQMARIGMLFLKEAVVDVLWAARDNGEDYLPTDEIRERLSIPPTSKHIKT